MGVEFAFLTRSLREAHTPYQHHQIGSWNKPGATLQSWTCPPVISNSMGQLKGSTAIWILLLLLVT